LRKKFHNHSTQENQRLFEYKTNDDILISCFCVGIECTQTFTGGVEAALTTKEAFLEEPRDLEVN